MPARPTPVAVLQEAVNAVAQHGTVSAAAEALAIPRPTLENRMRAARQRGVRPSVVDVNSAGYLQGQVKKLRSELAQAQAVSAETREIKQRIIGLKDAALAQEAPAWCVEPRGHAGSPGVPTLFLSDLHWGEVVKSAQIMGKNAYNLKIAHERMKTCVESAIHLLQIISPKMDYPGIVLPLGGDMISGNIHEELTATNEINSMPAVLDLYGVLREVIAELAERFGQVFLPCVSGNHGRDTHKIWAKDRHHTSFDWLLYCLLAKQFEKDKRVKFQIPDGPDALYRIYSHRYLLTHGDQFRGGDGMIGALGPIIRGDHKKRSRNAQVGMDYDTMIIGHWHQLVMLNRLIVNGSLKGYDEYAYAGNFPFEPPQQGLWLTHPKYRITYRMPVYVDRHAKPESSAWVSVAQ